MTNALIGYTGFVGSTLLRQGSFDALYNSKNIEDIEGRAFDTLVFAGAQAKKWWANLHPEEDKAGIDRALNALQSVKAAHAVLISTVDVLPLEAPTANEDLTIDPATLHAYGRHRIELEHAFKERFETLVIVRLPGLFGEGLKKNVVYDLLNNNQIEKINPASSFQYYDLTRLTDDIRIAQSENLSLVHLFTEPVATAQIISRFFPEAQVGSEAAPEAHYDFRTRHGQLFGGDSQYIERKDVGSRPDGRLHRSPTSHVMSLAVSNIAWNADEEADVFALLKSRGVTQIEIAPTKIWPDWEGATPKAALAEKSRLSSEGLSCPAFQAILFGKPELRVFGDTSARAALLDHISLVSELAGALGARVLVFGSPKNRDRGALVAAEAMSRGVEIFRAMGERAHAHGVVIGVEANPADYGCNFMTGWREAAELVRSCDHPGVRLHLDAACTKLAGDDIAEAVAESEDILAHVHISEPQLGDFHHPQADHSAFGAALNQFKYKGARSIEMRRAEPPLPAIATALDLAATHYV